MPYLPPLEDEDPLQRMMMPGTTAASSGPGMGSAAPAAPVAAPSAGPAPNAQLAAPGTGTGHINLETYLGLNQGAGQGMADRVRGSISTATAPGETGLQRPAAEREALYRSGEMGSLLGETYGQGRSYTPGMASLDSFLAGTGTQRAPVTPQRTPGQAPGAGGISGGGPGSGLGSGSPGMPAGGVQGAQGYDPTLLDEARRRDPKRPWRDSRPGLGPQSNVNPFGGG